MYNDFRPSPTSWSSGGASPDQSAAGNPGNSVEPKCASFVSVHPASRAHICRFCRDRERGRSSPTRIRFHDQLRQQVPGPWTRTVRSSAIRITRPLVVRGRRARSDDVGALGFLWSPGVARVNSARIGLISQELYVGTGGARIACVLSLQYIQKVAFVATIARSTIRWREKGSQNVNRGVCRQARAAALTAANSHRFPTPCESPIAISSRRMA
jgi:hypothetical protein